MIALWPAIDLMGGKVVRLLNGDPSRRTVYPERAVDVARRFARHRRKPEGRSAATLVRTSPPASLTR